MTSLHHYLKEIAKVGPNDWANVTDADFGFSFDYIIEDHQSIVVLDPTSKAALEWFYRHLPEDCPRWGKLGFAIERRYVGDILEGLKRDGLKSEAEYVEAMNNEERDRHAGENLDPAEYRGNDYGYDDYPEVY